MDAHRRLVGPEIARPATLAGYAVLATMVIACEAVARLTDCVATLERVITAVAARRAARFLLLAGWLWVGWHVFVRVNR